MQKHLLCHSIQTRHIFLSIRNEFDLFFKIETEKKFRNSAGATERIKWNESPLWHFFIQARARCMGFINKGIGIRGRTSKTAFHLSAPWNPHLPIPLTEIVDSLALFWGDFQAKTRQWAVTRSSLWRWDRGPPQQDRCTECLRTVATHTSPWPPKAPYDPLYGAFKVPHAVKQDFDLDLGEQTQLRHPAKYLYWIVTLSSA